MYPVYRQHPPIWQHVLFYLEQSLTAEKMVCALTSQLFHIPETRDLKGNAEMHRHLVPASYHRVTANGAAMILSRGAPQPSMIQTLTACIDNAGKEDVEVKRYLYVMLEAAPQNYKAYMQNVIMWQNQAEQSLQRAKGELQ